MKDDRKILKMEYLRNHLLKTTSIGNDLSWKDDLTAHLVVHLIFLKLCVQSLQLLFFQQPSCKATGCGPGATANHDFVDRGTSKERFF